MRTANLCTINGNVPLDKEKDIAASSPLFNTVSPPKPTTEKVLSYDFLNDDEKLLLKDFSLPPGNYLYNNIILTIFKSSFM